MVSLFLLISKNVINDNYDQMLFTQFLVCKLNETDHGQTNEMKSDVFLLTKNDPKIWIIMGRAGNFRKAK